MTDQAYTGHSGPFIVTTNRGCDDVDCHPGCRGRKVSWRAVATLGDLRTAIAEATQTPPSAFRRYLPKFEEGGTIGPLPDGTVIEVEPAKWRALVSTAAQADKLSPAVALELAKRAEHGDEMAQGQIIAAFNAAQAEGLMT